MTTDWNVVSDYCKSAYGKKRGETIKEKLWYLENRAFFALRGFTSLGWFKHSYPRTKMTESSKEYILNDMREGIKALNESIETAEYLKAELNKEITALQSEV